MASYVLSEYSSDSSDHNTKRKKIFPGVYLFDYEEFEEDSYVKKVVKDESNVSRRLIKLFTHIDEHRTEKWKRRNPEQAFKQNVQQLRMLIT
jgi:hypothetical protein